MRCMAMEGYANKFLDQLSGGERQRAFISMVIAQDTDYIVALKNGRLLRQGPVEEVIDSGVLQQVYDMNIDIQELGGSRVCLYFQ